MLIRQSDLSSYGRCAQEKHLKDLSKQGIGPRPSNLSRTVFGTIMHHAVQVMETEHHAGNPQALAIAKSTFAYYWNPDNMPEMAAHHPELAYGIDEWLPRDTYGGMRSKGLQALDDYFALLSTDDGKLLALELQFHVPIDLGEQGQHTLTGTIDRLEIRKYKLKPYLSLSDFKTGKQPPYLRYAAQWTVYSYASLQPEFWTPWGDEADEWYQRTKDWARRGRWIDLRLNKVVDAGWRSQQDYDRLHVALREYVRAVEADIYPLTLTGETCTWCQYRNTCGGVPVPDEESGRP
jgi:hypothetical protein